jgi:hypothetical protein
MCRTQLSLTSLVAVLALAGYAGAGQDPVAHYQFEGANDFSNTGTDAAAITGEPKGNAQIIMDDDRGSYVLNLAADGDYVYFDRSWSGIVSTEITVAAWVKTRSVNSAGSIVALGYAWRLRGGPDGNVAATSRLPL